MTQKDLMDYIEKLLKELDKLPENATDQEKDNIISRINNVNVFLLFNPTVLLIQEIGKTLRLNKDESRTA